MMLDVSLLFMRVMAGLVFAASGLNDVRDPAARSTSIELPEDVTRLLGVAELLGGSAVIAGVLTPVAAGGLLVISAGAVQKKVATWKTGFWGKDGLGWNYDLILASMLLVTASTGGGRFTLSRLIWR